MFRHRWWQIMSMMMSLWHHTSCSTGLWPHDLWPQPSVSLCGYYGLLWCHHQAKQLFPEGEVKRAGSEVAIKVGCDQWYHLEPAVTCSSSDVVLCVLSEVQNCWWRLHSERKPPPKEGTLTSQVFVWQSDDQVQVTSLYQTLRTTVSLRPVTSVCF